MLCPVTYSNLRTKMCDSLKIILEDIILIIERKLAKNNYIKSFLSGTAERDGQPGLKPHQ